MLLLVSTLGKKKREKEKKKKKEKGQHHAPGNALFKHQLLSHGLLPLSPRGSAWDPRLTPADLPSSLLGTHTRAFPARGKGWEGRREGGGLGTFLNNQPSEWQQQ